MSTTMSICVNTSFFLVYRYYVFNGNEARGYSVVDAGCIDIYAHTHKMGHNFGCGHNMEDAVVQSEYSYGTRYCDTNDQHS